MNRKQVESTEKQVLSLLKLSAEQVFELKLDLGIKYLTDNHPMMADKLKNRKPYWNWWRSIWANRDQMLISKIAAHSQGFSYMANNTIYDYEWIHNFDFYKKFHLDRMNEALITPNSIVIESSL